MSDVDDVIRLEGAAKAYSAPRRSVLGTRPAIHAVRGVDLGVAPGRTLGIVGESGSGKSTLGRLALALEAPTRGRVLIEGTDPAQLRGAELRRVRGIVQGVFQDPRAALDPRRTIRQSIVEPMQAAGVPRDEWNDRVAALLTMVGLDPRRGGERPGRFSGGQRQRVAIARALAASARGIVADEAVSALDVSVQAQILNLFRDLQEQRSLATMFISHDLAVIGFVADRTAVMYHGSIVETAPTPELLAEPLHPYTRQLAAAATGRPVVVTSTGGATAPAESIPETGCPYRERCPLAVARCADETPALRLVAPGRAVACHVVAGDS